MIKDYTMKEQTKERVTDFNIFKGNFGTKLIFFNKNMSEKDFPEFIRTKGLACVPLTRKHTITIRKIVGVVKQSFFDIGAPDFLIWDIKDRGEYYFCEFKTKNDTIRREQIIWMYNHQDYPTAFAIYFNEGQIVEKGLENIFVNNILEYENKQRGKREILDKKNHILSLYADLHPEIIGKKLTPHIMAREDGDIEVYYTGEIPKEVNDKWDEIDLKNG